MNKITFTYDELIMKNEDMADIVNDEMKRIDHNAILDIIISIGKELKEQDPIAFEQAPPIAKMVLVAQRMYQFGFINALYHVNEAHKGAFEEV